MKRRLDCAGGEEVGDRKRREKGVLEIMIGVREEEGRKCKAEAKRS